MANDPESKTGRPMQLTVVIPTRNRCADLVKAVESVCAQTRLPEELMVVDQSPGHESRLAVEALLASHPRIGLTYIHDPEITGLIDAKRAAVKHAKGDLVYFLDDDVVLEPEYIEEMERGFSLQADMMGCCGLVTNPPPMPWGYDVIFHLFHRGFFRDAKVGTFGNYRGRGHALIPCNLPSGGMSAWRREVFQRVPFDTQNGFFMLEDMDFTTRAVMTFGPRLYINPNARLAHNISMTNRIVLGPRQRRKLTEYITIYRTRRQWPWIGLSLAWLLVGLLFEALFQSLKVRSPGPVLGYFGGVRDGLFRRAQPKAVQP